jgi:hypothetical protein
MFSKPLPGNEIEQLFRNLGIYQDEYQAALPLSVQADYTEVV